MERTVGAALRGRPWLAHRIPKTDGLGFGEHDFKPRAATEGRPYSTFYAPLLLSTCFSQRVECHDVQVCLHLGGLVADVAGEDRRELLV